MNKLRTPDGWTVEQIVLDDVAYLRVTDQYGHLHGGRSVKMQGLLRDVAEVRQVMGTVAFSSLVPA